MEDQTNEVVSFGLKMDLPIAHLTVAARIAGKLGAWMTDETERACDEAGIGKPYSKDRYAIGNAAVALALKMIDSVDDEAETGAPS